MEANDQPAAPAEGEKIKVTRRQPCPCGSGKKFKACCEGDPRYEVAETVTEAPPEGAVAAKKPPAFSPKTPSKAGFNPTQSTQPRGGGKSMSRRKV